MGGPAGGDPEDDPRFVRRNLLESLRLRVQGPLGGPSEEMRGMLPTENYLVGVLAPQRAESPPEENDSLAPAGEGEDGSVDVAASAALSNSFSPSAMGFTCLVDASCQSLIGRISAGRYEPAVGSEAQAAGAGARRKGEEPDRELHPTGEESQVVPEPSRSGASRPRYIFRRRVVDSGDFVLDLTNGSGDRVFSPGRYRLDWRLRPAADSSGPRILTATVINEDQSDEKAGSVEVPKYLFQVRLELEGRSTEPFLPRDIPARPARMVEDHTNRLLYRDEPAFATGHGCAAEWSDPVNSRVRKVSSNSFPTLERPLVESTGSDLPFLSMAWLAGATRAEVISELRTLCRSYGAWVDSQKSAVPALAPELRETGTSNVERCRESMARMESGVSLLEVDRVAWESFQLMNRAILRQFDHEVAGRTAIAKPAWRLFQLAFILQCLPGICNPGKEEDPVHLLWFPTGGGKTEAYLGLAAFTICYRRKTSSPRIRGAGVTVLMRYTLRLLTVQQFQRASAMICALEEIRRKGSSGLGDDEISIGLWVGKDSTPNTLKEAFHQLDVPSDDDASPVQFSRCPACGEALDIKTCFRRSADEKSLEIRCAIRTCIFHDHLPLYVVDEEIYRRCPTLVVGTVDKFARMPWLEETKALFGVVESRCGQHGYSPGSTCGVAGPSCSMVPMGGGLLPPALVIQDELHLISGPLGTMVGVYEAVIDFLCRREGRVPLVVGSSATVRSADNQCRNLYGRAVAIFPPRALSPDETFFSHRVPLSEQPGRLFVGILPTRTTVKTTLIRVYSSLLVDRDTIPGAPPRATPRGDSIRDPYWTIVAYYNSLRELSGAQPMMEDDVPAQMKVYAGAGYSPGPIEKEELTSRRKGFEIPQVLARIETPLGSTPEPPDMLFATNMISVGMDVRRLSTMVVTGQPKATAEYIQATSRVGRAHPGLVIMVYNWARPRDRSHFEDFFDYHSTLYRHVETNSVTPYTYPALRRGVHALLVAAVRTLEPGMSRNDAAASFRRDMPTVDRLRAFLVPRLSDPRNEVTPSGLIVDRFEWAIDSWAEMARKPGPRLTYAWGANPLLIPFEASAGDSTGGLPTLNSLREVEPSTGLRYEAV
jgi:hypothetical protein